VSQAPRLTGFGRYMAIATPLVACRSKVVTDGGAFHKFISIAALHTATKHIPGPLTLSPRQATSDQGRAQDTKPLPTYNY
jgi:hypothetical protein